MLGKVVAQMVTLGQGDNLGVLPGGGRSKSTVSNRGQVGLSAPCGQRVWILKKR